MNEIYFKETGVEQETTILFLHGGGVSGWMWEQQLEGFQDYHCLVPDLPEHGHSRNLHPFSIRSTSEHLVKIIENRAKGGKVHIVGLSLGGQIAVDLLSYKPEIIHSAIICGTLVRPMKQMQKFIKPLLKFSYPLAKYKYFARMQAKELKIPEDKFALYFEESKNVELETLERIMLQNLNFELPQQLSKVHVPTLILAGYKEKGIIRHSAYDLNNVLPNSQGYLVAHVGHMINFEAPLLLNDIIRAWINQKPLPDDPVNPLIPIIK